MKHALNRTGTAVDPVIGSVSVDQMDELRSGAEPRRRANSPAGLRSRLRGSTEPADPFDREPTAQDLAAIDAEWPLIAAEIAVIDAEAAVALDDTGGLAARRLSVARRRLSAVATEFEAADADPTRLVPAPSIRRRSA